MLFKDKNNKEAQKKEYSAKQSAKLQCINLEFDIK